MKRVGVVCLLLVAVSGLIAASTAAAAPSCTEPSATVVEGQSVSIRLSCKVAPGGSVTYGVARQPQHGDVTDPDATGTVRYTPDPGFIGLDQFDLSASDQDGTTVRTAYVHVIPSDPPTCESRTEQVLWNQPSDLTLFCQGTSAGGVLTHEITRQPEHGTLTWGEAGEGSSQVRYEPAAGFSGTDSFAYHARNAAGTAEEAVVTIEVLTHINSAPTCSYESFVRVRPGRTLSMPVWCSDADGDPVTLERAGGGGPAHGTVAIEGPADWGGFTVSYTADPVHEGSDVIDLVARDGTTTVPLTPIFVTLISPSVNTAPVCSPHQFNTVYNGNAFGANCLDAEHDPLTFTFSDPEHGTLTVNDAAPGFWSVYYRPDRGYAGPDAFTVVADDGRTTSAPATVSIEVLPPHFGPPECAPAAITVRKNTSQAVNLGCTHLGETLEIEVRRQPAHGTLVIPQDGGLPVYVPRRGFQGTDSFTFVAVNEAGASQVFTQTLLVTNRKS